MTVNVYQSYSLITKFVLFVRGHELGTDLGALEVFSKCSATIPFLYNLPFDILGLDTGVKYIRQALKQSTGSYLLIFCFQGKGLTVQTGLALNAWRFACFFLWSARIKDVCHYTQFLAFLKIFILILSRALELSSCLSLLSSWNCKYALPRPDSFYTF